VKKENALNPVVAVEDELALSPQPFSMASWPSLYAVLSSMVSGVAAGLPLSQVSVLLEHRWHREFDEANLVYFDDAGARAEVADLQKLVQLMLDWRRQRLTWQKTSGMQCLAMGEALATDLELVNGENIGDPVLRRCATDVKSDAPKAVAKRQVSMRELPSRTIMPDRKLSDLGVSGKVSMPMSARRTVQRVHQPFMRDGSPAKTTLQPHGDRRVVPAGIVARLRSQIELPAK